MNNTPKGHRIVSGIAFALLVLIAISLFGIPFWAIRPFAAQNPQWLSLALVIKRWAPLISAVMVCVVALLALRLWSIPSGRFSGIARRTGIVIGLWLTVTVAAATRVNYFERFFFRPIERPEFVTANQAKAEANDMVMAVRIQDAARAYPIRTMAYHHLVNDTLAGLPIVVTY